jgi:hypothetical protein
MMDYNKIQELDPTQNMRSNIKKLQGMERESKKKDYYKILELEKNASDD